MYLTNKYTKWYKSIITNAKTRVNQAGYFEKHHIIPKSLGGSNDSTNLVELTAKEHFICHMLLPKMTEGESHAKMVRAAWMIATMGNKHHKRIKVNSRTYCKLKDEWVQTSHLRKPRTKEHCAKLAYPKSDEHKKKISDARTGKSWGTHTATTKSKMSEWQKGIPKPTTTCEHCNKTISELNYKRWHGFNCKHYASIFCANSKPERSRALHH